MTKKITPQQYHERTKHQPYGYAASPGYLDWETQPNPFREYEGAKNISFPLGKAVSSVPYADCYRSDLVSPQPFSLPTIGKLFELSFGLSVWKSYRGDRWSLRCNPSSGNLHPTESYLIIGDVPGLSAGTYHYNSYSHALEERLPLAGGGQDFFLVGLSSVHWREEWKYGERAFRYCQHDVGHAVAGLSIACASLGWRAEIVADAGDDEIVTLLGLKQSCGEGECESPDLLVKVCRSDESPFLNLEALVEAAGKGDWQGKANVLSPEHAHEWPLIKEVEMATKKPAIQEVAWQGVSASDYLPSSCKKTAEEIIKTRRSAQRFDGKTGMGLREFSRILDMTLPRRQCLPWSAFPWKPKVNLVLFIHRVEGLEAGLYLFLRNPDLLESLKGEMSSEFLWEEVSALPDGCPLYLLEKGDFRRVAASISCQQSIASDSAFSLGMLAEFNVPLQEGSWNYRRLFWEAGAIGQVLYLEAEAAGFRGTGIGCYLDDVFHELLGLKGETFQDMYHFTVGTPLTDNRLLDSPPYPHREKS